MNPVMVAVAEHAFEASISPGMHRIAWNLRRRRDLGQKAAVPSSWAAGGAGGSAG